MKLRVFFLFLICCAVSCAQPEPALLGVSSATPAALPFDLGRACFSGTRGSYDTWAASVVSRNGDATLAGFETRIPRAEYENHKRNLDCHFITYPSGELFIRGIYIRPKFTGNEKLPVVIVNRGGNAAFGAWNLGRLFHTALPLAAEGFVVIGSQYRGSRRGAEQAASAGDEFGGKDVDDVLALIDLIDRMPGVDPARIGMSGWSRGGIMTFIAATRTDRLGAIAVGGTPTDLAAELLIRPEMERVFRARIPGYDDNKEAALAARSALKWAGDIEEQLPILILHGADDDRVSLSSAENMAEVLRELERPFKLLVYEDGTHGLMERKDEVRRELSAWFKEHLAAR